MRSWFVALALAGCAPAMSGEQGSPDAAATTDGKPPTGDPGLERFVGTLAKIPAVPFGGSPYCNYTVTLQNIVLDVAVHPDNGLLAMVVGDTRVEAVVGSCPYPPAPQNRQQFEHRGGYVPATATSTFAPPLTGVSGNSPLTDLTAMLSRDKAELITASLRWHRTDVGAPLDWTVTTPSDISLDRIACQPGGVYCLGGSIEGAEYACGDDGIHLFRIKTCSAGCAPTQQPPQPPPAPHTDEHCN